MRQKSLITVREAPAHSTLVSLKCGTYGFTDKQCEKGEIYYVFRKKAKQIAEDFMKKTNPTNWEGNGEEPDTFKKEKYTYDISSIHGNVLDISYDYDVDERRWIQICELRDKYDDIIYECSCYRMWSEKELTETIMFVCEEEN